MGFIIRNQPINNLYGTTSENCYATIQGTFNFEKKENIRYTPTNPREIIGYKYIATSICNIYASHQSYLEHKQCILKPLFCSVEIDIQNDEKDYHKILYDNAKQQLLLKYSNLTFEDV